MRKRPLRDDFPAHNTSLSSQKALAGRFSGAKYKFIRPKGPCGTLFQLKIQFYPPKSSLRIPLRGAFSVQNTILYATRSPPTLLTRSGYTCSSTKHSRRNSVVPTNQGNGTQGDQMGPKGGDPRAPSAPFRGMGPGGLWGYSEVIPNGKPCRMESMESNYEWKTIPISKPFQG